MKYSFIIFVAVSAVLVACGGKSSGESATEKPTKEGLVNKIKEMEDSLRNLQANASQVKQVPNLTRIE